MELAGNSINKINNRIGGAKALLNEVSTIKNYKIENVRASNWNNFILELNKVDINPTNNRYKDLRGCFYLAKKHYRCRYCGYSHHDNNKYFIRLEIEHIKPRGGKESWKYETYENLDIACTICNGAKGIFDEEIYLWWINRIKNK